MSKFFECQNDPIIKTLYKLFDAHILRIPEERILPCSVLACKKNEAFYAGQLEHYVKNLELKKSDVRESKMANISGKSSSSVNLKIGISCLDSFLKGFGVTAPNIKSAFSDDALLSFSFNNVVRYYIDFARLGNLIGTSQLDNNNPSCNVFLTKSLAYKMLVIDSVIACNEFTITSQSKKNSITKIKASLLENVLSSAEGQLNLKQIDESSVTFIGQKHLSFAFSCIQVNLSDQGEIQCFPPHKGNIKIRNAHSLGGHKDFENTFTHFHIHEKPGQYVLDNLVI